MSRFWVFLIYNLLLPFVLLFGLPRFVINGIRRGGLARNFWQRLGVYSRETKGRLAQDGNLWIHAVSVGEVLVALKVVRTLHEQTPETPVVLSTTTTTGFDVAETEAGERVTVIHNPVDLPFVSGRTIRLIRPERLVLVEAEIWPNLVRKVRARGVPVVLVNARLSERSERRFKRFAALTRPIFRMLDLVCVPFEEDIARWEGLGVDRNRIELTGSVKFDEAEPGGNGETAARVEELRNWLAGQGVELSSSRILLAASTHAGEEALIGRTWLALRRQFPDVVFVVVPRHAERGRHVAVDFRNEGIVPVAKVPVKGIEDSDFDGSTETARGFIANTTGELRAWYHLADVVIIGKSLIGRGGQNPVEPILAGKPVIAGPGMGNFTSIVADLKQNGGIIALKETGELEAAIRDLLENSDEAGEVVRRGKAVLDRHRGASARTADWVVKTENTG